MKRTVVVLPLLALALAGCSNNQSGGTSNPDSQVVQPPAPDSTSQRSQGADPGAGPDASASGGAGLTGGNGAGSASANPGG